MTINPESFKLIYMNESFSEIELRKLDLNLLLVFSAIIREGSVGKAAKRLYLGPSAISMALTRLRDVLGDPLFVRGGSGMVPTPRAEKLWTEIEPALAQIEAATRSDTFDPSSVQMEFTLGAPDDLEFALVPRLLVRVAAEAPGVRLVVQPMDFRNMFDRLDDGSVDLGLSALPARGKEARHLTKTVRQEQFHVVFDPSQLDPGDPFTVERFAEISQILVSIRGDFFGPIDEALSALGHSRRIIGTVARFATIPFILRRQAIAACVPSVAAGLMASEFGLASRALPFPSPEFELALAWHRRTDEDAAYAWFRRIVENELEQLV